MGHRGLHRARKEETIPRNFNVPAPKWVEMVDPIWSYHHDVPYKEGTIDVNLGMYRVRNADDLVTWGRYMGHSAGRYQHWVTDLDVWAFLTLLDPMGFPHVTIHLKDMVWFGKPHPDDGASASLWPWGHGPAPKTNSGRATAWLPSTAYEDVDWFFRKPIELGGKKWVVMDASHRDKDKLQGAEFDIVNAWYQTVVIGDSKMLEPPVKGQI